MFNEIFAAINDVATLKTLATSIVNNVNEAYQQRAKELLASNTNNTQAKTENKTVAAKAKEAAAKMKKEVQKQETNAPAKTTKSEDDVHIAITNKAAIKKLGLTFEKYNDKCWVLRGDTKPIRNSLKEFKGVYNSRLNGGEGWVFRTAEVENVANALGLKVKIA